MNRKSLLLAFSLIEMLIILTVIGVLLSIGLPSFNQLFSEIRLRSAIMMFSSALQQARRASITSNQMVSLVKMSSQDCAEHWLVEDRMYLLPEHIATLLSKNLHLTYRPDGRLLGISGHVIFFDSSDENHYRLLSIATTGKLSCCRLVNQRWVLCNNSKTQCTVSAAVPSLPITPGLC